MISFFKWRENWKKKTEKLKKKSKKLIEKWKKLKKNPKLVLLLKFLDGKNDENNFSSQKIEWKRAKSVFNRNCCERFCQMTYWHSSYFNQKIPTTKKNHEFWKNTKQKMKNTLKTCVLINKLASSSRKKSQFICAERIAVPFRIPFVLYFSVKYRWKRMEPTSDRMEAQKGRKISLTFTHVFTAILFSIRTY